MYINIYKYIYRKLYAVSVYSGVIISGSKLTFYIATIRIILKIFMHNYDLIISRDHQGLITLDIYTRHYNKYVILCQHTTSKVVDKHLVDR